MIVKQRFQRNGSVSITGYSSDYEIVHNMIILLGRGVFFLSVITILGCPPSATLKGT